MDIKKTINGNEAVLTVTGWLDTQAAPELHTELENLEDGVEKLVLDLAGLEYISSSGVREVVAAYKKMNGALVVKNTSAGIMSIFKATGIDKKIKFE
ncbi:MAG: STAS domain-containing protein [Lachnospiraceae bacterium]|nr:STAS domain-containing protein [Lachnospiraceae bacterium]